MICFYIDTTSNYLYTGLSKDNLLLIERKLNLAHDLSTFALDEVRKMLQKHQEELNKMKAQMDQELEAAKEKLTKSLYELSEKHYKESGAQAQGGAETTSDDVKEGTVYDADYKVEDDDNDDNN